MRWLVVLAVVGLSAMWSLVGAEVEASARRGAEPAPRVLARDHLAEGEPHEVRRTAEVAALPPLVPAEGTLEVIVRHQGRALETPTLDEMIDQLRLTFDTGVPLEPSHEFDVLVLDEAGGLVDEWETYLGPPRFELPPSRYEVVASGAYPSSTHGEYVGPRTLGRARAWVDVLSGGDHRVELSLDVGAWVELTLIGVATDEDRQAVLREHSGYCAAYPEEVDDLTSLAKVELRCGGRNVWLPRVNKWNRRRAQWVIGRTDTSDMVPTGTYELVAVMPSGRRASRMVELCPGETTAVQLVIH